MCLHFLLLSRSSVVRIPYRLNLSPFMAVPRARRFRTPMTSPLLPCHFYTTLQDWVLNNHAGPLLTPIDIGIGQSVNSPFTTLELVGLLTLAESPEYGQAVED